MERKLEIPALEQSAKTEILTMDFLRHCFQMPPSCYSYAAMQLFYIRVILSLLRSGAGVKIPGAPLQRGSDPQRNERPGEEKHPPNPRLIDGTGLLSNQAVLHS